MARAGAPWRLSAPEFPPWETVYSKPSGGCFEAMINDLLSILRLAQGKQAQPSCMILDGERCSPSAKADRVLGTMVTSAKRAARCTWR